MLETCGLINKDIKTCVKLVISKKLVNFVHNNSLNFDVRGSIFVMLE